VSARSEAPKGGAWVSETRQHRKALAPLDWDARALWRQLRGFCADMGNDGRLPVRQLHVAVDRTITQKRAETLMAVLVDEGFATLQGDCWVLDWSDQPSAEVWNDPVKRERWARAKALNRDSELCKRIKERDRNLCRYCGVRVDWSIKTLTPKVGHGGSYDHVDPDGNNSLENVVVACRLCNSRKRDRTPDQAGMTLLRPGTTAETAGRGLAPGQPSADAGPAPPLRAPARPDTVNTGPTPVQPLTAVREHPTPRVPSEDPHVA
jgi:hypothetical protein